MGNAHTLDGIEIDYICHAISQGCASGSDESRAKRKAWTVSNFVAEGEPLTRERTVTWEDPIYAAKLAEGLTGLEIMQAIRDRRLPPMPMARLIGFDCIEAEPGAVSMRLEYDESLENSACMLHGANAAALLDTAMGAAAHTTLPAGSGIVTVDLNLTYLRPVTANDAPVVATARVKNQARRIIFVLGEIHDRRGRLVAHASGNFSIFSPRVSSQTAPQFKPN